MAGKAEAYNTNNMSTWVYLIIFCILPFLKMSIMEQSGSSTADRADIAPDYDARTDQSETQEGERLRMPVRDPSTFRQEPNRQGNRSPYRASPANVHRLHEPGVAAPVARESKYDSAYDKVPRSYSSDKGGEPPIANGGGFYPHTDDNNGDYFPTYEGDTEREVPYPTEGRYYDDLGLCECSCNFDEEPEPRCQWKMIFKAVSGTGVNVLDTFVGGGGESGVINARLSGKISISNGQQYRDGAIIDNWNDLPIREVKMEVFSRHVRKAWWLFDGISTNSLNWQSKSRLIASSYEDAKYGTYNTFQTNGVNISFAMLRSQGDCDDHCGYFVILEPEHYPECLYQEMSIPPVFVTGSRTESCTYFNSTYIESHRMVISVKLCDIDD